MKTTKTILIALATICMLVSCKKEKDEYGNYVTYYKNKTAIHYVYSVDSLTPVKNYKMHIQACVSGPELFPGPEHIDYCYSDQDGRCSFKFVKKINMQTVDYWGIAIGSDLTPAKYVFSKSEVENITDELILDTIFVNKKTI
jgi:hypothetical protein